MADYITKDDDMVDAVCWKHYGRHDSALVAAVYRANRSIALEGPKLRRGLVLDIPPVATAFPVSSVRLWD